MRFTLSISVLLICFSQLVWAAGPYFKLSVFVVGLPEKERAVVLSRLSIQTSSAEKKINLERIENLHQCAPEEIAKTLQSQGYYHYQISSSLNKTAQGYEAFYRIQLNRPTILNSMQVQLTGEGRDHPKLKAIAQDHALKLGHILQHQAYEEYKEYLLSQAIQAGFLQAAYEKHEIKINSDTFKADINLVLNTGKPFRMGKISFHNPPYPESYLRRYVLYEPGTPYSTEKLAEIQKNFTDSELYRYVRVEPQYDETTEDEIPLCIHLRPLPKNRYFGSLGYGTDTGLRGMLGWERRRCRYPGHQITTTIKGSQRFNQANFRYIIPGLHPATDRFVMGCKITQEKERDKKYSFRTDLSLAQIKKVCDIEYMAALNFLSETYQELQATPKQHSHFLMPSMGIVWTNITETDPRTLGFRLNLAIKGASKPVLSTTSFLQGDLRFKGIVPFGESARFIFRTQIGVLLTSNFNAIPLSMRYFAGGDHSVRGYGYKTLGPRQQDPFGNLVNVGAPYLLVSSVELEKTIYKNLSIAAFYDAGNAMNKFKGTIPEGAGMGLHYHTPIGELRLDVAYPLHSGKVHPRIHFTFGTDL